MLLIWLKKVPESSLSENHRIIQIKSLCLIGFLNKGLLTEMELEGKSKEVIYVFCIYKNVIPIVDSYRNLHNNDD